MNQSTVFIAPRMKTQFKPLARSDRHEKPDVGRAEYRIFPLEDLPTIPTQVLPVNPLSFFSTRRHLKNLKLLTLSLAVIGLLVGLYAFFLRHLPVEIIVSIALIAGGFSYWLKERSKAYRAANDRLRESQSFLDSVIENIPNMIFVKDAKDLRFVRFNKAGESLLGIPREKMIGKNDYDFFPKEQADFFTKQDRQVLAGLTVLDIPEEPLTTKYGKRFLHTKKIPLLDKKGKAQYLLGISEDITDRKEAEQQKSALLEEHVARTEAEKSAQRLAFLAEATATLSQSLETKSMLDNFAKILLANLADWCAIDIREEQSINRVVASHNSDIPPQFLGSLPIEKEIQGALSLGQPKLIPDFHRDTSCMIVPLVSHENVLGALTFLSIKKNRRYSNWEFSLASDLGRRASLAIENARLFKKAQEASQAKSAFLANMSHEIRTPLGAMLGFAEIAREEGGLNEAQSKYLSTILKNGRQLLRIVDEILDLSKVESDHISIELVAVSLPKLLEEISSLLQIKAKERGLELLVCYPQDQKQKIITDPTRLRQILLNIVSNAIKFTEKGNIKVSAQMAHHPENPSKVELIFLVEDSGIGISEEQLLRLFRPFEQADSSTTRRFGGTGLGLFLSRKLANLLGGDVTLQSSTPGKGSTFKITITAELAESETESAKEAKNTEVILNRQSGLKILVIEDAPDNRLLLSHYLAHLGFEHELVDNGHDGIKKALTDSFDIILMDIQMPQLDGFEAVQILRTKNYQKPVIALTAHAMKGDREKCLEKGFDDYICKPVTRDTLAKSLLKNLSKKETTRLEGPGGKRAPPLIVRSSYPEPMKVVSQASSEREAATQSSA